MKGQLEAELWYDFFLISANRLMYSALRKTVQHKHPTPKSQRCVQPLYSQLGWRKQGSIGGEIFSVISWLYKINPGVITIIYSEQELK